MKTDNNHNVNPAEEALDRGIERLISRELSDMVDYKSLVVNVRATRQAARQSIISSTYFSSHEFLAKILAEGAD